MGFNKPVEFSYEELLAPNYHFSDDIWTGSLWWSNRIKGDVTYELKILSQTLMVNVVSLLTYFFLSWLSSTRWIEELECAVLWAILLRVWLVGMHFLNEYVENASLCYLHDYQIAHSSSSFSLSGGLLSWKLRVSTPLDVAYLN